MKFGILQIVVILVLVIFLLVAVVKPSQNFTNNSRIARFGDIMATGGSAARVSSITVNTIQFNLAYTTPQYYTNDQVTDNAANAAQRVFKPKPLLFLLDVSNMSGADAAAKATTLNGYPNFSKMKVESILNKPTAGTSVPATPAAAGKFSSGLAGAQLDLSLLNLIDVKEVQTGVSNVTITGDSTTTSQAVSCTIAPSINIVTTPLVIGRHYVLGLSLMNGVDLPTVASPSVWAGTKSTAATAAGITTKYSPFKFVGFTIADSNIVGITDASGIPLVIGSVNLSFTDYTVPA